MQVLMFALAMAVPSDPPALCDEPTYKLTVEVDGVWGEQWVQDIQDALGRLEGVKSSKKGKNRSFYVLEVLESKSLLPSEIIAGMPEDYEFVAATAELAGSVELKKDAYTFTARGSKQVFSLEPNDELRELVKAGKTDLTVTGKVTESEPTEKERKPPLLQVTKAEETPKKK